MTTAGDGAAGASPSPAAAACGNGVPEPGEICDGASCPTECPFQDECSPTALEGSASDCTAQCTMRSITDCVSGDGCCAAGCKYPDDQDCPRSCGDGVVDPPEVCEPRSTEQACPTSCDDMDPCTADMLSGRPEDCNVKCSHMQITAAVPGDQCCPPGANANSDSDCKPMCNNGVKEAGETCDPVSSCPTVCDDRDVCTTDKLMGSAARCTAECVNTPITRASSGDGCCPSGANATTDQDCKPVCGNGVREGDELCEGSACPSSCPEDRDPCTSNKLVGSRANCDAMCVSEPVTRAINGDGCCPAGMPASDGDCLPPCGNGKIDTGEECDDSNADDNDGCLGSCKLNVCGDGHWRSKGPSPEECDLGDRSNLADGRAWDRYSCSSNCKRQYAYTPCATASDCGSDGLCDLNRGNTCVPRCSSDGSSCLAASNVPGYCVAIGCFIRCDQGGPCPANSTCEVFAAATDPGTMVCVPK